MKRNDINMRRGTFVLLYKRGVCYCGKEPPTATCVWPVNDAATPILWREKLAATKSIRERDILMC
jgi:hypothetical protein